MRGILLFAMVGGLEQPPPKLPERRMPQVDEADVPPAAGTTRVVLDDLRRGAHTLIFTHERDRGDRHPRADCGRNGRERRGSHGVVVGTSGGESQRVLDVGLVLLGVGVITGVVVGALLASDRPEHQPGATLQFPDR